MPIRRSANLVLLFLFAIALIAGVFVVVGLLGAFLLPLLFVFVFLMVIYFMPNANWSGLTVIGGIIVMFLFGYGAHLFLGSVIGFDPAQVGYQSTLATVKLGTVGYSVDDATFSALLGFVVIIAIVILAFAGLFFPQMKRGRR